MPAGVQEPQDRLARDQPGGDRRRHDHPALVPVAAQRPGAPPGDLAAAAQAGVGEGQLPVDAGRAGLAVGRGPGCRSSIQISDSALVSHCLAKYEVPLQRTRTSGWSTCAIGARRAARRARSQSSFWLPGMASSTSPMPSSSASRRARNVEECTIAMRRAQQVGVADLRPARPAAATSRPPQSTRMPQLANSASGPRPAARRPGRQLARQPVVVVVAERDQVGVQGQDAGVAGAGQARGARVGQHPHAIAPASTWSGWLRSYTTTASTRPW